MSDLIFKKMSDWNWKVFLNGKLVGGIDSFTGAFHAQVYGAGLELRFSENFIDYVHAENAIKEHFNEGVFDTLKEINYTRNYL